MSKPNLTKKPLIEAIFEAKWQIAQDRIQLIPDDSSFSLLLGRFYDRVKEKYPFVENLPITQVPAGITPYQVRHRLRVKENLWPLTQIGRGIITFNETSNYDWDTFRINTLDVIAKTVEAYPGQTFPKLTGLMLRYINAYEFDFKKNPLLPFLKDKLKVELKLPSGIVDTDDVNAPAGNKIFLQYPVKGRNLYLKINFATGVKNNQNAVVWDIVCGTDDPTVELHNSEEMKKWIDASHESIEKCFFGLIKGDLEKEFQ